MSLRVLEVGGGPAAGYCGKLFARWGAEVIAVQRAEPLMASPADRSLDHYLHHGKQRVALDYTREEGRDLLDRLAGQCDVLVTDEPARIIEPLRLLEAGEAGPPAVRVAITPFGLDGPYRDWEATPATLLALGGYTALMGDPGRAPLTLPIRYLEYQSGQLAYTAALAAHLGGRSVPDAPTVIDIGMLEVLASLSQFTTVMWTYAGRIRSRHGNRWENLHPTTLLPCADGWYGVNALPAFWPAYCYLIGHPELVDDPRFASNADRMEHADELDAIAFEAFEGKTRRQLLAEAQEQWRVPIGAALTFPELLEDDHLAARGFWEAADVDGKRVRMPGSGFRLAGRRSEPAE
ncbi:MAG: hypothetical protein GEU80_09440 [Dehalococcoidia bacterium]|nr:hypothetical protein [Dehalococcoidia bacterium]